MYQCSDSGAVIPLSGGYADLNAANAFDATNSSHSTRAMIAAQFLFMPNRTDYPWYSDGACEGFYPATRERIGAASFGRCSIRCGRLQMSHGDGSTYASLARGT